jgi:peptide/nickel transport system substrate-binding protein
MRPLVIANVYETLIWYNGSSASELVPMLATEVPTVANGGISADGLTYTYHLRTNVKFHNGETMTSEDVAYSISRVLMINDADGPAWMLGQVLIENYYDMNYVNASECAKAIWAKDTSTVQFNLTMSYPAFNYIMAYTVGSVVSKKFVEENGGISPGEQSQFMNSNTCGTGPYTMEKWVRNQQILLQRNDNYWRTPASIQYVIIKKANDYGTRLMMLQAGDADTAFIPRIHESDVSSNPDFRIVKDLPTFNLDFLGLNQNINMTQYGAVTTGSTITATFFADPNVRLAFAHSFDYDKAIETYFQGGAIEPNGIIPYGMTGYNDTVPIFDFNLTKAAAYLNAALVSNASSVTWGAQGFKITLMYNAGNEWRALECQLLKEGLEKLASDNMVDGEIVVTTAALDWPVYLDTLRAKGLAAFFLGWAPDYADPDDYINPFIHGSGTYAKRCGINNATLTAMCEEAASELNETQRDLDYYNISIAVYNNCYYIWTAQATNFHVEQTWVTGYYFNPMYPGLYFYTYGKSAA